MQFPHFRQIYLYSNSIGGWGTKVCNTRTRSRAAAADHSMIAGAGQTILQEAVCMLTSHLSAVGGEPIGHRERLSFVNQMM